jgi:hypothetical protein
MAKVVAFEMKKKIYLLLISITACTALIGGIFLTRLFREDPIIIMELAIYDETRLDGTYYFTLDENGVLRSYHGARFGYRLTTERPGKYMRRVRSSTRTKLNEEEMSMMIHLLDRLGRRGGVDIYRSGGRWLELIYNSEDGEVYFRVSPPPPGSNDRFAVFLRELRKLTGVTIEH